MLTYVFDKNSGVPLYEQLYRFIKADILSGKISGGSKLPSKRELAANLGISKVTVESAYASLISEGYVYSLEKKGYYCEKNLTIQQETKQTEKRRSKPLNSEKQLIADLSANSVPTSQFPFSVWSKLTREVIASYSRELLEPIPYNGVKALRDAIAQYVSQVKGMSVDAERIIIGAGSEYLYSQIIRLLGNDKIYAIENPSYRKIAKVYDMNGVSYKYIPVRKNGIDIDALKKSGADAVHISPSHNFPTGNVTDAKVRHEIISWAKKDGRFIIEDDFDSELRFNGLPLPPLQTLDTDSSKVIYINTFSKTISPAFRISYMILPLNLSEKYARTLSFNSCTVPSLEQFTLARFISSGHYERHINRMKKYYKLLRSELFEEFAHSELSQYAKISEAQAGLHFIIEFDSGLTDKQMKAYLDSRGVNASFMSDYYTDGEKNEGEILVNYSGLNAESFGKVLKILSEAKK